MVQITIIQCSGDSLTQKINFQNGNFFFCFFLFKNTDPNIESQYQGSTVGGSLRGAGTKSCCESLCGDLLQTLIALRSTSTVFAQKYFGS